MVLVLVDGVCGLSECQTLQNRAIALFWHQKDFLPDHIETPKYQNVPIYAFQNSSDKIKFVKIHAHESHFTFNSYSETPCICLPWAYDEFTQEPGHIAEAQEGPKVAQNDPGVAYWLGSTPRRGLLGESR